MALENLSFPSISRDFARSCISAAVLLCILVMNVSHAPAAQELTTREERINHWLESMLKQFPEADADGNGEVTIAETVAFQAKSDKALRRSIGGKAPLEHLPEGLIAERDVTYGQGPEALYQKLDIIYHKDASQQRPAIVMIHGGGFHEGNKAAFHPLMCDYAIQGYVTLSITYRFIQIAPFPAQVADCKLAVRWLRSYADEYGVDPGRIGVTGASAGGYLTAMLALTDSSDGFDGDGPYGDQLSTIQAAAPLCGVYDLSPSALERAGMGERGWAAFLGETPSANPEVAWKASPLAYVSKDAPPILIVHARDDVKAPALFSEELAGALESVGAPYELCIVDGSAHGWRLPYEDDLPKRMADFFARYLQLESAQKGSVANAR